MHARHRLAGLKLFIFAAVLAICITQPSFAADHAESAPQPEAAPAVESVELIQATLDQAASQYRDAMKVADARLEAAVDQAATRAIQARDFVAAKNLFATGRAGPWQNCPAPELVGVWARRRVESAQATWRYIQAIAPTLSLLNQQIQQELAAGVQNSMAYGVAGRVRNNVAENLQTLLQTITAQAVLSADPANLKIYQRQYTIDARANTPQSPVNAGVELRPGDLLYVFPNTTDQWTLSAGQDWLDYRGRNALCLAFKTDAVSSEIAQMYRGPWLSNPFPLQSPGLEIVIKQNTSLLLYCNDKEPADNQGAIRVTLVVVSPRDIQFSETKEAPAGE